MKKPIPIKRKIDLTEGNILKKLLIVAIPTLLTSLAQMTYNLTDMFWVGRVGRIGLNPIEAVAAVGTAGYYPWFGFGMILIVKVGVSVLVSQSAGRNDKAAIERYATNGIVLMAIIALIYSFYGLVFTSHYVGLFNIESVTVVEYATAYLRIISLAAMAMFMVNLFNGVYDGLGKTINTFYITVSGLILNMILDPVLILGFGLGVTGAAIATAISQTLVLVIYIAIYVSRHRPVDINFIKYVRWAPLKQIFRLGLPVGLQSMIMTVISIVIGVFVASYGPSVMSINRVGSQIEALSWMVASGFQVALASFIGQNYGAYKIDRVKAGYITSLKILVPYGLTVSLILFVFARPLFQIFISDPVTLAGGVVYLRIFSISQLFMILELMVSGAFNGLGKTKIPSMIGILGNSLRIPFAFMATTAAGIWWTLSLSSVLKGTIIVVLFAWYLRKLIIQHNTAIMVENLEPL